MKAALDHLVVACGDLDDGIDWLQELTGVDVQRGGKHVTMGTHNALLRLGTDTYIELIAIDPDAPKPAHPRWFALDTLAMKQALLERPRLVHWVASVDDIAAATAAAPIARGTLHAFTRGALHWRLTVPDDGSLPAHGVLPTLIAWDGELRPAPQLPASRVTLAQLAASHPEPDVIRRDLAVLGLADVIQVTFASTPRLAAMVRTPRGLLSL